MALSYDARYPRAALGTDTALQRGAGTGNLLGNLLCAITGLLDGGPALNDTLVPLLRVVRQLVNIF